MLILTRRIGETIIIVLPDGEIIKITAVRIDRGNVKIGIEAPDRLPVHRQEIFDAIQRNKQASLNAPVTPPEKIASPPAPTEL